MEYKDYYKVLGVPKSAMPEQIKKAYKKLAIKLHPDKNPGDKTAEAKFKELNEANQILGNPEKRKQYDEMGENWDKYANQGNQRGYGNTGQGSARNAGAGKSTAGGFEGFGGGTGSFEPRGFSGDSSFADFFESFFGAGGGFSSGSASGGSTSGGYESVFGGGGRGERGSARGHDLEAEITISLEEAAKGTDYRVSLDGNQINLKLKPGLREGQKLRLKGKGGPGSGGADNGDLQIQVHIVPDTRYERKGDDLYFEETIPLYTAVLGGKAQVHTLERTVRIEISPGTDSNKVMRLKGLGMPQYGKPTVRGDAYVTLVVEVPKNLSDEEKALFTKLSEMKKS